MREKYESLSLVVLKDLAKARGLKGISAMKKGELVERMLEEDERDREKARTDMPPDAGPSGIHPIPDRRNPS